MPYLFRSMSLDDGPKVMEIFNHHVTNSFAAYPQDPLPLPFFDRLFASYQGYPNAVAVMEEIVVGFGGLRAYSPIPVFRGTAEVSYFLNPAHTGKGLGSAMLDYLENGAKEMKISCLLASISSRNEVSLAFHERQGFKRCGTLEQVGLKNGMPFDVVYMQKFL